MWLSPMGAGAKAHADEHCEATMSIQLSGTKRWRIGQPPPATPATFHKQHSLADGVSLLLTSGWDPTHAVDLQPGDVLFLPPGWVHETTNIGRTCAASITYQWDSPAATGYVRHCGVCFFTPDRVRRLKHRMAR
jgi:ribosomal protein L16 Arg81 hydroxylase